MKPAAFALLVLALVTLTGCGPPSAKVAGRVTSNGKGISGLVQFSPFGEGPDNTGTMMQVQSKEDGAYDIQLKTIGKHRVIVIPDDINIGSPEREPWDRSPQTHELKAGDNVLNIELPARAK